MVSPYNLTIYIYFIYGLPFRGLSIYTLSMGYRLTAQVRRWRELPARKPASKGQRKVHQQSTPLLFQAKS